MHARGEVTEHDGPRAMELTGYCHDVTDQWLAEERRRHAQAELASHQLVLERIARGEPLEATLDLICGEIEWSYPGATCSVLMVDGGDRLRHVAGPSLPPAVREQLDGLPIRDGGSACGTAAARNAPVVVEDTLTDPLTADFTELAVAQQLRSVWSHPLTDTEGRVVGTFALYRRQPHRPDETERRAVAAAASLAALALERSQNLERLSAAARFDSLTGLSNRAWFLNELSARLAASDGQVAVMFMDLDGFKWINDSLGHPTGDRILLDVARRLRVALGEHSTVARFGGDEFASVVLEADVDAVEAAAATVEAAMAAPFVLDGGEFFLSVSTGIAYSLPGVRADELIRDADTAMYAAKERGGSGHATFNSRLRDRAVHRVTLEAELRRAIERDEFVMHYQPIVDLRTRTWAGIESLVRWEHPTRGLLAPDAFIPFAEESGLIVPLGAGLLRQVVEFAVELGERLPPHGVGLNVSPRQLSDPSFVADVLGVLDRRGLPAEKFSIEITETALIKEIQAAQVALDPFAHRGIALIIDDFGCGYSSIARLRELPVTGMKIDKSFCSDLGADPRRDKVVGSIGELAHALELFVVVEGIESGLAARTSVDLGADFGQGYHFARPAPAADLVALLERPPTF